MREEWPKQQNEARLGAPVSPAAGLAELQALGVRIQASNVFGVVPSGTESDPPAPWAVCLAHVIEALGDMPMDVAGWQAFDDWPAYGEERTALARQSHAALDRLGLLGGVVRGDLLRALLLRCATLGPIRGWDGARPSFGPVTYQDGRPAWFRVVKVAIEWDERGRPTQWNEVEVDGWDYAHTRPYAGAYPRNDFDASPASVALARAEWQIWRAGLDVLREILLSGPVETWSPALVRPAGSGQMWQGVSRLRPAPCPGGHGRRMIASPRAAC